MRWNAGKNESLRVFRGVTFEAVVVAIEAGGLLDVVAHPNAA
ncbi:MAG: toxin, partial [Actinobacteria bacterium]|nr:toxin [Actinomycetota bacterium]